MFNVAPLHTVTSTHPSRVFDLHYNNSLFLIETVNAGFSIRQIDYLIRLQYCHIHSQEGEIEKHIYG